MLAVLRGGNVAESLAPGEEGTLILDRTSFYAERGGQIGDRGTIAAGAATFDVRDTQYLGDAIAHHGVLSRRTIAAGDAVRTVVAPDWGGARFAAITRPRTCCSARSRTCSAKTSSRPARGSVSTACDSTSAGPAAR